MKFDICCVGHMCTDILIKPVDRLPERGKLELIDSIAMKTGGCAMNTSIGLAKLGISTAIVGKTGMDGFGTFMRDTLEREGVHTRGLRMEQSGTTSASVVNISSDGERCMLHCLGTNSTLSFADVDQSVLLDSRILFIGGAFLTPAFDGRDAARLLKLARQNGILTAMDTAWDSTGKWYATIRPCLAYLDWFMPSVEEAEQIFGSRDPMELAARMKAEGVKNAVVKLGADGCYVEPEGREGFFKKPFHVQCVDTAGAGDAWCAGFLSALVRGYAPEDCAEWGNAVGALCVTQIGTTSGILDFEQTAEFLRANAMQGEEA